MYRLKQAEIETARNQLLEEQNSICPLCGKHIEPDEAVLDHDHETGHIRAALHRSCNSSEGAILQFASQRCKSDCPTSFIKSLVEYWKQDFSTNPIHPSHRMPEEKERLKLKRKLKKLKRQSTIDAVKAQIKSLDVIIKEKASMPWPQTS